MAKNELVTPLGDSAMDETSNALRVISVAATGTITATSIVSAVTTNTTSTAVASPSNSFKTFFARLTGTGSITQTMDIYGNVTNDNTGGVLLATITLSGSGQVQDAAPTGPLPWDENAPWWVTIKARLTDKRRTG